MHADLKVRIQFEDSLRKRDDNIKVEVREMIPEGVQWTHVARDCLINTVMCLLVICKASELLVHKGKYHFSETDFVSEKKIRLNIFFHRVTAF